MLQKELEPQKVGIRDFQHNFANHYLEAKRRPIIITRYGKDQLVVADVDTFELRKVGKPASKLTPDMEFFGMYKDRKAWKNKSSARIAKDLRKAAWYGKKNALLIHPS